MKKVLFIVPQLGSGGIEKLVRQWYPEAKRNGIEYIFSVIVAGGKAYDFFSEQDCKIMKMEDIRSIGIRRFLLQYYKIIKKEKIDILHIPASPTAFLVMITACIAGCRNRIIHAHTNFYNSKNNKRWNKYGVLIFQVMNNIFSTLRITCSDSAANYCFGNFRKNTIVMLKNGIDINKYTYLEELREKKRKELHVENDFVIGNVGRFTYQKNQSFVIEILRELLKYNQNCKLILFGEGEDEQRLHKLVEKYGLQKKVLFLGVKSNLEAYYQAMDAFVFPSRFEGLGIAAVEAQAVGTLTYISEFVPDDTIISDSTIRLSLEQSPEKWAEIIWRRRELRNLRGKEEVIQNGYNQEETIKKMIDIYLGVK